ncbi:DUF3285 domain-containing protein [Pseudanabaena sp. UWO310]|nr:DUF3285 domain-containing protein [Pseudanabaena sp. UWO310]TYQ24962.1 DUF3285 domain-containing protein [Pseudanabaena sp. UWO310]
MDSNLKNTSNTSNASDRYVNKSESNIDPLDKDNILNKQKEKDSFVKLAMRNMVKKGSTSLFHLALTVFGVIGTLLGLAIIFH